MDFDILSLALPDDDARPWVTSEHDGNLLVLFPAEVLHGVKTQFGESDAVRCDRIVDLDTAEEFPNVVIFGAALVPNIGPGAPDGIILGRLSKLGKARVLADHTEEDLTRCTTWINNSLMEGTK